MIFVNKMQLKYRRQLKKKYKKGRLCACKAIWSMKAFLHNIPDIASYYPDDILKENSNECSKENY